MRCSVKTIIFLITKQMTKIKFINEGKRFKFVYVNNMMLFT